MRKTLATKETVVDGMPVVLKFTENQTRHTAILLNKEPGHLVKPIVLAIEIQKCIPVEVETPVTPNLTTVTKVAQSLFLKNQSLGVVQSLLVIPVPVLLLKNQSLADLREVVAQKKIIKTWK